MGAGTAADAPPPGTRTAPLCRRYRFYALFIVFYLAMYAGFAAFYTSQPGCISKVHNFWHALWFSVTSSATIGERRAHQDRFLVHGPGSAGCPFAVQAGTR